jgi:transposase
MNVMTKHPQLISAATPKGKHSVVNMDKASWYQLYLDAQFANISIIHLSPYSPELNPIEQVWDWLRQNEITIRCFKDYNDIVDKCCLAWNQFCEDQKRVILLCYGDWTNLIR